MPIAAAHLRLLFERHSDALVRFAASRVDDPEDVVAEAFLRAFRSMPEHLVFDEAGQRAWLFRVVRNLTISTARRRAVAERYLAKHVGRPHDADERSTGTGDESLATHLAALPERQRVALELRFLHDLDVDSVAQVLGMTAEATRALTYRALSSLRRSMVVPTARAEA